MIGQSLGEDRGDPTSAVAAAEEPGPSADGERPQSLLDALLSFVGELRIKVAFQRHPVRPRISDRLTARDVGPVPESPEAPHASLYSDHNRGIEAPVLVSLL